MSKRTRLEAGFTLIELLVVVAIIGILAAIAIPQYATYKKAAVDANIKSDLHNAATAMEAYYGSNNNTYSNVTVDVLKTYGYRQSPNLTIATEAAGSTDYVLTATSAGGNATAGWRFNSNTGAIVSF